MRLCTSVIKRYESLCAVNVSLTCCHLNMLPFSNPPPTQTPSRMLFLTESGSAVQAVRAVTGRPSRVDNPATIPQLQLHLWLKFTAAHTGSGPLTVLGIAPKPVNKLISWPPPPPSSFSSRAAEASSGRPWTTIVIAWQRRVHRTEDDSRRQGHTGKKDPMNTWWVCGCHCFLLARWS